MCTVAVVFEKLKNVTF